MKSVAKLTESFPSQFLLQFNQSYFQNSRGVFFIAKITNLDRYQFRYAVYFLKKYIFDDEDDEEEERLVLMIFYIQAN